MSKIIELECAQQKIEKIVVFADRAEINRKTDVELQPGINEVHIRNVSNSIVHDSLRVDGRGDATIHEVQTQDKAVVKEEKDSPRVAELRTRFEAKKREVNTHKDRLAVLNKRVEALDKAVTNIGNSGSEQPLSVDEKVLGSYEKFYAFYEEQSVAVREKVRDLQETLQKSEGEHNKLLVELNSIANGCVNYMKIFVITLESEKGGKVELDISYQVFGAGWVPSYDLRVDNSTAATHMRIVYSGRISQNTGEDWKEVPLILSTAQPCLGGEVPQLGTLEASFYKEDQNMYNVRFQQKTQSRALFGTSQQMPALGPPLGQFEDERGVGGAMGFAVASNVSEQALSTEFTISRPALIPSGEDNHKVTIGVIDMKPQLIYVCVPKKSNSVFLTASAVNESQLPLVTGQASVFLNNSFVAHVQLKTVSPGERFTTSLGVDSAIRVIYKPVKKYTEQAGLINKTTTVITEQIINLRNTRNAPIMIAVKDQIPRSTDDKLKIRVLAPTNIKEADATVSHIAEAGVERTEGAKMTAYNNLEWSVKLGGGQVRDLVLKYAMDYPAQEKVTLCEKF